MKPIYEELADGIAIAKFNNIELVDFVPNFLINNVNRRARRRVLNMAIECFIWKWWEIFRKSSVASQESDKK